MNCSRVSISARSAALKAVSIPAVFTKCTSRNRIAVTLNAVKRLVLPKTLRFFAAFRMPQSEPAEFYEAWLCFRFKRFPRFRHRRQVNPPPSPFLQHFSPALFTERGDCIHRDVQADRSVFEGGEREVHADLSDNAVHH